MANISIEGDTSRPQLARREPHGDPFKAMREFLGWEPVSGPIFPRWADQADFAPAFEVKETKDAFEFQADVPGVDQKDLSVKLMNNRLSITGKRESEKTDKSDTYYAYERSYGSFARSFTVPEGVNADAIRADLKDGVLKVVLPKKPEAKARDIQVKSG